MKAIETTYKGYRFRSRLEARWAVFLDALGAQWSYEHEGFDLNGTWYLPDFWVDDWDCWIEVKGKDASDEERRKCALLARASNKNVLLLSGDPWTEGNKNQYAITLYGREEADQSGTSGWEFGEGRRCAQEIWLVSDEYGAFTLKPMPHERDDKYPLSGQSAGSIVTALSAARGAQFEHGKSG